MSLAGRFVGTHLLADLHGLEPVTLRDGAFLETVLRSAASDAGAHVLGSHFHSFGGSDGVTGVVLLAESHLSIHTWPEHRFAALDIFMCGNSLPQRALDLLLVALRAQGHSVTRVDRGAVDELQSQR